MAVAAEITRMLAPLGALAAAVCAVHEHDGQQHKQQRSGYDSGDGPGLRHRLALRAHERLFSETAVESQSPRSDP